MTRDKMISRWEDIIPTVFRAEDNIREQLQAIIAAEPDKERAAKEYVHAIAVEIVSRTTDEQLANLED